MKVLLPDALHARPANLLVRLAAQHDAQVVLFKGTCRANAGNILEVLSLGAAKGDEIDIVAEGAGAEAAIRAIAELVARSFDSDLVPERGSGAVEGIAIGRALIIAAPPEGIEGAGEEGEEGATGGVALRAPEEERARLAIAERRALAELAELIAVLAPEERALFEPEKAIVREVAAAAGERVSGGGTSEEAIRALTANGATDLIVDARARLIAALARGDGGGGEEEDALARAGALGDEIVVVAERLTPSLVAQLPPRLVRGIVAVDEEPTVGGVRTSHAAILARGRELPLAMVPSHVAMAIAEGDLVVVDTTASPARVWVAPSDALVEEARGRQRARAAGEAEVARAIGRAKETLGVALLVNVGSLHDRVPEGVAGVGLLRTELLFAARTAAPAEGDQVAAILAIARAARGTEVTARLWDAGGDKPLAWLPPSTVSPDERGVALLFRHRAVLATQLAAIARAAERTKLRALIPMTRGPDDVRAVRAILEEGAGTHSRGAPGVQVPVGAMIETPEAAAQVRTIAEAADFVCIGTNDLASLVLQAERTDARQALDPRVLSLIAHVIAGAHAAGKKVTICGEVAADPRGARLLVGLGADALSVAPPRLAAAARALEGVTLDECRSAAAEAVGSNASNTRGMGEAKAP